MPFYLDHPAHGAHVCYSPEDVKEHEKIGWLLRDPQPGVLSNRGQTPAPQPVGLPEKRKPGRPKKAE